MESGLAAKGVSELALSEQGLRNEDAERVGQRILEEQETLTSLDLRGNELTDAACDALAASIAVVPSLRLVDLTDNAITNAGRLTIFRALANARRRCNVLLSGEGVRDILLAVKQPAASASPTQSVDTRSAPGKHESPPVTSQRQRVAVSELGKLSPPRVGRTNSPSALAEKAIAEAERAMARSQLPRGSPFDDRVEPEAVVRDRTSKPRDAYSFDDANVDEPPVPQNSPSASAAPDEVRLQDRGLTAVPSRLGEDRPGRVRPRKIDLSDNMLTCLSGLPQSVVQLRAANNLLHDWDGINTLPRLQRLDLSHNKLHQMGPFGICCAIRVLRLKGNSIGTLAGIEGAARTLIELDVSDNALRGVDDIQPLTGCTRLTSVRQSLLLASFLATQPAVSAPPDQLSRIWIDQYTHAMRLDRDEQVKLDGNPLLKDVPRNIKSRAYRGILARLPEGCTLVEDTSMPSGPLFTPSRPSNRATPGSSSSSYSERRRRRPTPSSTTGKTEAAATGGESWPRRAASVAAAAQRLSNRAGRGGSEGPASHKDSSSVAVDLSAPSPSREWDRHKLSSLVPPDDDAEPYQPAVGENLYTHNNAANGPASRPTIFSTGGSGPRPTSPLRQRTRRHWSPSGRRNDANDAKVKAVAPRSATNKHLSFRGKEQRRAAGSRLGRQPRPTSPSSASNLMTPTKSIGSKYARSSPPRDLDAQNGTDTLGRLAGHPGWPASPPPSAPQRLEANQTSLTGRGASSTLRSPTQSHQSASMPRRAASAPKRRPRRSPSPSRVHGGPSTAFSAHGVTEPNNESETVNGLNAKITKLYNWHLAEMDLVQKQQVQLNQVTAELEQTRSALNNQEKLLRLQLAADSQGVPIDDISMAQSDLQMSLDGPGTVNSMSVASSSPERPTDTATTALADAGAVAAAAMEAAVAAVAAPTLETSSPVLAARTSAPVPLESVDSGALPLDGDSGTSLTRSTDVGGDTSNVLPPEPTMGSVDLSGVPLSAPVKLHDLQEELSGTVDELAATRKALGHALTIMQSAGIADGKLKPLRQMLHQSGVTSPGPSSPTV